VSKLNFKSKNPKYRNLKLDEPIFPSGKPNAKENQPCSSKNQQKIAKSPLLGSKDKMLQT
jgi:hypothetical protein